MKSILLGGLICLAVGFLVGRTFPAAVSSPSKSVATSGVAPAPVTAAPAPPPVVTPPREVQNPALYRERMDALGWLASSGEPVQMRLFSASEVNPVLARLLELNEYATTRLAKAYAQARSDIDATRAAQAKATRSADGTQLVVEAPGLDPTASGQIYDRFASELSSTLGPERQAMLHKLSGESIEQSLDGFGLNPVRYELTLKPVPGYRGVPMYDYKRHHLNAAGETYITTGVRLSLDDIRKHDPVLAPFVPPSPGP